MQALTITKTNLKTDLPNNLNIKLIANVALTPYNFSFYQISFKVVLPTVLSFLLFLILCFYFAPGFYLVPYLFALY